MRRRAQIVAVAGRSIAVVLALFAFWAGAGERALSEAAAESPAEAVSVIDGDTLQIGGRVVQIYGIDAPELGQRCYHDGVWTRCGLNAAFALNKLIRSEHTPVHCLAVPERSDRICLTGTLDVAKILLESGYAVTAAQTSEAYREAEASARRAGLGLWHERFLSPEAWRAGARLPDEPGDDDEPCPVKAVVSDGGDRLYYVPTDAAYDSLAVEQARGGRLFCGDEPARRAGWRREGEAPG